MSVAGSVLARLKSCDGSFLIMQSSSSDSDTSWLSASFLLVNPKIVEKSSLAMSEGSSLGNLHGAGRSSNVGEFMEPSGADGGDPPTWHNFALPEEVLAPTPS